MRIGTWNVEYGKSSRNPDRLALLKAQKADIWVLTETHSDINLSETHFPVCSDPRPILGNRKVDGKSTWVTIWSRFELIRRIDGLPDKRRMVAAIFDAPTGPLAVAGVVLPWHSDRGDEPSDPAPRNWDELRRVLRDELPRLFATMRQEAGDCRCVLAGDFNSVLAQPYPYSNPYPPNTLRMELRKLLHDEKLVCHTADTPYPLPSLPRTLIDHVCTNMGNAEKAETWTGIDGKSPRLSDHPGVVVTLPGY